MKRQPSSSTGRAAGYTLMEVVIAIAVLSVGMVAIFALLPAGLNVQRDNREETIIKFEALYWMEALRSGGAALPGLKHVDWIEVKRGNQVYTADYSQLDHRADWVDPRNLMNLTPGTMAYLADIKRSLWPTDLVGWLSVPDTGALPGDFKEAASAKRVRAVSLNGPVGRPLEYIMECQVIPDSPGTCLVRLTFKWPTISKPQRGDLSPSSGNYDNLEVGKGRKVFTTRIAMPGPVPADYPGRMAMALNLSLTNMVATNGLPQAMYFLGTGDAP